MRLISIILTLYFATSSGQRLEICNSSDNHVISKDITQLHTIDLDLKGASLTWQAARGSPDLTVTYTKDLEVTLAEQEDKTLLISVSGGSSGQSIRVTNSAHLLLSLLFTASVLVFNVKRGILLFCFLILMISISTARSADCLSETTVHLTVPIEYIARFCETGQCWPVLCQLSLVSEYSAVPSNLDTLFADRYCTIKEPTDWKNWTEFYLGPGSEHDYYGDIDGDGLVNILEYYGSSVFDNSFTYPETRLTNCCSSYGSSPVDPDSDGDLLQDGFETYNGMDANSPDDVLADYDSDSLSNLDEQIYHLDPFNPDSDGDGVFDGIESQQGGNPSNPADGGQPPPSNQRANIRLTVGDWSPSNSERFILHVGDIAFQSPDFGVVGSDEFTFTEGQYDVTIQHAGTNLPAGPDYDYEAYIQKVSGGATVAIDDPDGLLGQFNDVDPTGTRATLIVQSNCSNKMNCVCQQIKTCTECFQHVGCEWCLSSKQCRLAENHPFYSCFGTIVDKIEDCPCMKCNVWNEQEKEDEAKIHWRRDLNRDYPCPCRAEVEGSRMVPIDQPRDDWDADFACSANEKPWCSDYHPGAFGCMRSSEKSDSGARQQCCYYADESLIPPGDEAAAGTPDRAGDFFLHQYMDVWPYHVCCKDCEIEGYCSKYNEVRRGNDSHCN